MPSGRCNNCEKETEELKICSRCNFAQYCSAECSKAFWPKHKKMCMNTDKFRVPRILPDTSKSLNGTLFGYFLCLVPQLHELAIAAARKYLWRPEHLDPVTGNFTRYLAIEYEYEVLRVPPPHHPTDGATAQEKREFPTSRVPQVQMIGLTGLMGEDCDAGYKLAERVAPTKNNLMLVPIMFKNEELPDDGRFEFLPWVPSGAIADEITAHVDANGGDGLSLITRFNGMIFQAERWTPVANRDLCDPDPNEPDANFADDWWDKDVAAKLRRQGKVRPGSEVHA